MPQTCFVFKSVWLHGADVNRNINHEDQTVHNEQMQPFPKSHAMSMTQHNEVSFILLGKYFNSWPYGMGSEEKGNYEVGKLG